MLVELSKSLSGIIIHSSIVKDQMYASIDIVELSIINFKHHYSLPSCLRPCVDIISHSKVVQDLKRHHLSK